MTPRQEEGPRDRGPEEVDGNTPTPPNMEKKCYGRCNAFCERLQGVTTATTGGAQGRLAWLGARLAQFETGPLEMERTRAIFDEPWDTKRQPFEPLAPRKRRPGGEQLLSDPPEWKKLAAPHDGPADHGD
jgi:hypothetical protein